VRAAEIIVNHAAKASEIEDIEAPVRARLFINVHLPGADGVVNLVRCESVSARTSGMPARRFCLTRRGHEQLTLPISPDITAIVSESPLNLPERRISAAMPEVRDCPLHVPVNLVTGSTAVDNARLFN
jgi:hypothetical protein